MVSKHSVVLLLLVVGATITRATIPQINPIANVSDPKIQTLGSFAVEEYDKRGESHLFFKEVIGGHTVFYPPVAGMYYYLDLKAINCSQSGALANYTAEVLELWLDNKINYFFYGLYTRKT